MLYNDENADPIASIESTSQLQARTTASVICASQNTLAEPLFTVLQSLIGDLAHPTPSKGYLFSCKCKYQHEKVVAVLLVI